MGVRYTRVFSALVSVFCVLVFSSAPTDAGQTQSFSTPDARGIFMVAAEPVSDAALPDVAVGPQSATHEPLLLAASDDGRVCHSRLGFLPAEWNCKSYKNNVYICHVKKNGKYKTKYLPEKTAEKKADKHPDEWILGKCEDVVSPS
jgi:hypothetical protein